MSNDPKKICLRPKALLCKHTNGSKCNYIATYATIFQLYSQISVSGQMQLYCILCNYIATYATILQLYATILQQFHMQLYATMQHATYATYATLWNLCNFTQLYATLRNLCNNATYATMQLYGTICNLCNYATI
jgi:hypothetical protein